MHVFDRRAKLLQRERAAANKEVEKFDFLKEEVQSLILNKSPSRRWVTGWRTEFWMLLGEWRWRSTSAVGGGGFSKHWFSDAGGAICIVQVGH